MTTMIPPAGLLRDVGGYTTGQACILGVLILLLVLFAHLAVAKYIVTKRLDERKKEALEAKRAEKKAEREAQSAEGAPGESPDAKGEAPGAQ